MTKRQIILVPIATALLLGGCMGTQNRGLESVHQPVVDRQDYVLDLATQRGALAAGEERRLAGWMDSIRVGYGDRVAIDDPARQGYAASGQVAATVAAYGLLLSDIAPVTAAPVAPGTIRVVVSRMRAHVPGCPDWSRSESHEFDSNTSSNQGCAVNTNLAAMVANPEDLVRGKSGAVTIDPLASSKAIDAYRRRTASGASGTVQAQSTGGK